MTYYSDAELNAMADFEAARLAYISVHTADPGTTGASEVSGGTYARKVPTFSAAGAVGPLGAGFQPATPGVAWSDLMTFDIPAAMTVTHWSAWTTVTTGTYRASRQLTNAQVLGAAGPCSIAIGVGPVAAAA